MNDVTVPDDVYYKDMTEEQQAVVRMWLAMGLRVQIRNRESHWVNRGTVIPRAAHPIRTWHYRLKP